MASYAILRTKKLNSWGSVGGSIGHTYRVAGMAPNADPKLLGRNKTLIGNSQKGVDDIRQRIDQLDGKPRSNAVLCIEHLLTASPSFFENKTFKQIDTWAKRNISWLEKTYGKENVVHAALHLDESTPHIVAYVVPEIEGRLNARAIFGGREKLRNIQTSYAEAMKPFKLQRGVEGSKAKHQTVKSFYADINKVEKSAKRELVKLSKTVEYPAPTLRAVFSKEYRDGEKKIYTAQVRAQKTNIIKTASKAVLSAKIQKDEVDTLKQENSILSAQIETLKSRLSQAYELLDLSKDEISKLRKVDISLVAAHLNYFDKIEKNENAIDLVKRVNDFDYQQAIAWLHNELGATSAAQAVREHLEISKPTKPATEADNAVKNAINTQLNALSCKSYRISIISGDGSGAPYLPGKSSSEEKFYDKEAIINMIPYLRYENNVNHKHIFITPMDDTAYYILIDDLSIKPQVLFDSGYKPCIIQNTSWNSTQAVLKIPKTDLDRQDVLKFFNGINREIGDNSISGLRHPFRLAGFRNMKPKHEKDGLFPFVKLSHAVNQFCKKTYELIKKMGQDKPDLNAKNQPSNPKF